MAKLWRFKKIFPSLSASLACLSPLTSAKGIRSLVPMDQDVPFSPRQVQCYPGLGHEYTQSRTREWLLTLQ